VKGLRLLGILGALTAATAHAQVTRFVVENDTAVASATVAANPGLLRGQEPTKLIAITCAANSCTRTAPSNSSSPQEGLVLSGIGSYIITASLSTGTFSGGGAIEIYLYANDSGSSGPSAAWLYVMGADIVPTSGKSAVTTLVQTVSLRPGAYRMVARANAVTTSAAAPALTVSIRACQTATCAP
jgi:hypothetical protein